MKTLLTWLLHRLLFSGTLFLAAGAVAVPEVGGGDAPADNGGSPENLSPEGAAPREGIEEAESPEPAGAVPELTPAGVPDAKLDNRTLPQGVKTVLEQLKASDPKAHTWLKDELFANRAFRQELPGGVAEAKELKAAAESFKTEFPEGIPGIKAEKAEWANIDSAWQNADPKVLDIWRDASPEAFSKLMPVAINKFADTNPEAYKQHMADVLFSTMQQSNVTGSLYMLSRALQAKDVELASSLVQEIQDWVTAIHTTAKTPPKAPVRNPELDQEKASVAEEKRQLWVERTSAPINTARTALVRKELAQYVKGEALDDDTFTAIEAQVMQYLNPLLSADPTFGPTIQRYEDARDAAGMKQFVEAKLAQFLPSSNGKPGPVERAYKLFFRGATPKPNPKPAAAAPNTASPTAAPPKGWTRVAQAPEQDQMAPGQFDTVFSHQAAILRDGRKVFWGKVPPPA